MAGGIVPKIYSESDFADSAPKRTFTEDDFADKPDPSMWERLSSGFMGKEIAQPKGFDIGDVYEGIGSVGLETLGGTLGTPFGPAGIGLGAATGSALHSGIKNILNPETATTPLQTATRAGAEGLLQGTGAKYTPVAIELAGRGLRATGKFLGKRIAAPILRGTTAVSKNAFNALIKDSKTILENVGMTADDIATKGQDLQSMISSGKAGIETSSKKILAKRQEDLSNATQKISEHADYLKSKAVEYGQELQSKIGLIREKAGAEYRSAINKILGDKSLKYGLDPGAAYPYRVDMHEPLMDTIKTTREKVGYNLPGRVSDDTETAIFNKFQNVINNMDNASVDEVYWLQRDLRHAMDLNKGKPISSALGSLRSKVLTVLEEKVPEIAPANKGYRAAMEMSDELSAMETADVLSNQVYQAFKYGGNKRDALLEFGGVDKEANSAIEKIIKTMDDYHSLQAKGKEIGNIASKIGDLAATYKLGESKNVMLKLAEKDPTIKSFLVNSGKQEEIYKNLGNLMEGDNISKQIIKVMSEGGNKKDSLMELARTNPEIGVKISEIQNAIFGSEFSPWFREIPQTGMGKGILLGTGAALAKAPLLLPIAPLFSPRLVGLGTRAAIKGSENIGKALTTLEKAGRYSIPTAISSTEQLMRKHYEAQK